MNKELLKILFDPIGSAKKTVKKVNETNKKKEEIIKKLLRKK